MPIYYYSCKKCGSCFDQYSSISDRNMTKVCPDCGGVGERDLKGEFSGMSDFSVTSRDNPRWSESLGINPDQAPLFKKTFGDLMQFDSSGRCLVMNREHKKKIMKARGFVELD